jgi:hypothetical protein
VAGRIEIGAVGVNPLLGRRKIKMSCARDGTDADGLRGSPRVRENCKI